MKKKVRKLQLNAETLRNLEDGEYLYVVEGGVRTIMRTCTCILEGHCGSGDPCAGSQPPLC
jgi:hypothetical protein